jgi:hypothetical protein
MKKIYTVLSLLLFALYAFGQEEDSTYWISYTPFNPVIDGVEDELWLDMEPNYIEKDYTGESATVTAYWKALWDSSYFYVLVSVEDNDHYPSWESGGGWYEYDQPEVYLDLNEDLKDGRGASMALGHYQIQPHFVSGGSGVPTTNQEAGNVNDFRPDCGYCYVVTGENYVWEYEISYDALTNLTGETMSIEAMRALDQIGFDVYIIDQDQNITTSRQRKVWSNTGTTAENYLNMDDAGTIVFVEPENPAVGISGHHTATFSVYPNPVTDYMNISVSFDRLVISNVLGQYVWSTEDPSKRVYLGLLHEGIYFVQAYKNGQSAGIVKICKE